MLAADTKIEIGRILIDLIPRKKLQTIRPAMLWALGRIGAREPAYGPLNAVVPDNAAEQKQIIFDPIPRVDGIEPSADPLLELRAAIYLMSGRRRRSA